MDIATRAKNLQKEIQALKASQTLGESNYVVYTYTTSVEFTVPSGGSPYFYALFQANEEAFTIATGEVKLYINGALETFTSVGFTFDWDFGGTIMSNARYSYNVNQYTDYINKGKVKFDFSEFGASWNGERVRFELTVRASRPGTLEFTQYGTW